MEVDRSRQSIDCSSSRNPSLRQLDRILATTSSGVRRDAGQRPKKSASTSWTIAPTVLCAHGGPFGGRGVSRYVYRYFRLQSANVSSFVGVATNSRLGIPGSMSFIRSARLDEVADSAGNELDRDRAQQQTGDPRDQEYAVLPEDPHDHAGEPQ